jgi:cytochrome c-type biogenesis protein
MFTALSEAVQGSPPLALAAAFVWGVLSILLSPCHLAAIPLIVGFIGGQGSSSTRRALGLSTLFAGGMLVTIALIGILTAAAGRLMGDVGRWGFYGMALVLVLVGLLLLDVLPAPWTAPGAVPFRRRGPLAALLLGLVFGIALGPCTFAFMAPMLAVVFAAGSSHPVYGGMLLLAYGVGHSAVIVLAGAFTGVVQRYLDWNERSRGTLILKRICGGLVVLGGLYLIYIAP